MRRSTPERKTSSGKDTTICSSRDLFQAATASGVRQLERDDNRAEACMVWY
jgi:hypothetical protein